MSRFTSATLAFVFSSTLVRVLVAGPGCGRHAHVPATNISPHQTGYWMPAPAWSPARPVPTPHYPPVTPGYSPMQFVAPVESRPPRHVTGHPAIHLDTAIPSVLGQSNAGNSAQSKNAHRMQSENGIDSRAEDMTLYLLRLASGSTASTTR